ncbi:MAG: DUF1553 domain-containing protein [Pirellulaceae bacterium]
MANRLTELEKQLADLQKNPPDQYRFAMSVKDVEQPTDGHLHIRGEARNLGPIIPRGFLTVATQPDASPLTIASNESGRLQLAHWIASENNPLTARVYVNRVWHHLFGRGLVATPDNFGSTGASPSHPELLDMLAYQFMRNGWSTKDLIRRIMHSRVYRLSSERDPEKIVVDPRNELRWRADRRAVEAEVYRDAMLDIAGNLDYAAGGSSITAFSTYDWGYDFGNFSRRSVYAPLFRNVLLEIFEVFDIANPNLVTGARNNGTLPTQSLFLMNDPFVVHQAYDAAERLLERHTPSSGLATNEESVVWLYRRILGRGPTESERKLAIEYLEGMPMASDQQRREAWGSLIHMLFASIDFRYLK